LHALFSPASHEQGEVRNEEKESGARRHSEPALAIPEVKEREAIKVFIVTWNMGDALVSASERDCIQLISA
jgi:hypothetical protein